MEDVGDIPTEPPAPPAPPATENVIEEPNNDFVINNNDTNNGKNVSTPTQQDISRNTLVTTMTANQQKLLTPFGPQFQVFSAVGAVVALITVSLIFFTAYLAYKVYFKGELHFKDAQEQNSGQK